MAGSGGDAGEPAHDERLLRLCWRLAANAKKPLGVNYPCEVDDNGSLHPEAISIEDLKSRGFSIQRRILFGYDDALKEVSSRYERTSGDHECAGFVEIVCADILAIAGKNEKPAFNAVADGQARSDLHDAHTSVKFSEHVVAEERRKLRKRLCESFQRVKPIKDLTVS